MKRVETHPNLDEFASYRQSELDNTRIQAFTAMEQLPYMSKRFMLQRFLGLSEDEIKENEELWREERDSPEMQNSGGADLRSVGITPGGMETDITTGEEIGQMQQPGAGEMVGPGAAPAPGAAPGGV